MRSIHHSILLFVLAVCISSLAHAQEKEQYKKTGARIQEYYNLGLYDSIFFLFAPQMKAALPQDKARAFFEGLKKDAGAIRTRQFRNYQGSYAVYKTNFEKAIFAVQFSLDANNEINGMLVKPYTETEAPEISRNKTSLSLPFREEWTVFWGGDTKELNYHVEHRAQKGAFDLVITDEKGKSYRTNGRTNEDYYAFGKELLAPCDGYVVSVVDGVKDNVPGEMNPLYVPGNTVIIKTKANEYLLFAHFKQGSIRVKQGQPVRRGQLLGLCGNSGNSSEPHLHFHIQNTENMVNATGAKCYFDKLLVNGKEVTDYSPIKGDRIRMTRDSDK